MRPDTRAQRARSSPPSGRSRPGRYRLGGRALVLLLLLLAPSPFAAGEEPVVVAEVMVWCGPGWRTEVYASGYAHQRVVDTCITDTDRSTLVRITPEQLESIRSAVERFGLCSLPERIEPETFETDEDLLSIRSAFPGMTCGVSGFGLERVTHREVVDRFNEILCAITRIVPEPPE